MNKTLERKKNEKVTDYLKRVSYIYPVELTLDYFGERYTVQCFSRSRLFDNEDSLELTISLELETILRDLYKDTFVFTLGEMVIATINSSTIEDVRVLTRTKYNLKMEEQ